MLRPIAAIMKEINFKASEVILEEGITCKGVFFLMSGRCRVSKKMIQDSSTTSSESIKESTESEESLTSHAKYQEVFLGEYGYYDYFGEEAVIICQRERRHFSDSNLDDMHSSITVTAVTDVTVCHMTSLDALNHLGDRLELSPFCQHDQKSLKDLVESRQEQKMWEKYKTKAITGILRERQGDPILSIESFNHSLMEHCNWG
jgi:CRP-like cAMP-binding protein